DYSHWESLMLQSGRIKKQEAYWLKVFKEKVPQLNLPIDFPRPAFLEFEGRGIDFEIGTELSDKIKITVSETGTTLYILLLAVYTLFLSKYTGRQDIVVGSPIAARTHDDLKYIIGMFVNMIAMRNFPGASLTFREFLTEVKQNSLQAFENQDYQFDSLVEKLDIQTDPGRHPLVDTVFVMQNIVGPQARSPRQTEDLTANYSLYEIEQKTSKFDLLLSVTESPSEIKFKFEYGTRLFRPETIKRMSRHFRKLLERIIENPDSKMAEIEMLSDEEVEYLLKKIRTGEKGQGNGLSPQQEDTGKVEGDFDF
ncbi:MAG: hypothetical protein GY757_12765, partial [bacterium]|nr:hypothetical protein [bacterium]